MSWGWHALRMGNKLNSQCDSVVETKGEKHQFSNIYVSRCWPIATQCLQLYREKKGTFCRYRYTHAYMNTNSVTLVIKYPLQISYCKIANY